MKASREAIGSSRRRRIRIWAPALGLLSLLILIVSLRAEPGSPAPPGLGSDAGGFERLEVPPPPFSEGIFPCSDCHAGMEVNRTRRTLTEMHTDIVLKHDEEHRWCLDCHDPVQRDSLHLASGERISFDESYRLCGQCHGEKLRDWKAGVHGRRTGYWNGHKQYLLCAHCHNPHQPRFRPLAPKPPPERPQRPGHQTPVTHEKAQ